MFNFQHFWFRGKLFRGQDAVWRMGINLNLWLKLLRILRVSLPLTGSWTTTEVASFRTALRIHSSWGLFISLNWAGFCFLYPQLYAPWFCSADTLQSSTINACNRFVRVPGCLSHILNLAVLSTTKTPPLLTAHSGAARGTDLDLPFSNEHTEQINTFKSFKL